MFKILLQTILKFSLLVFFGNTCLAFANQTIDIQNDLIKEQIIKDKLIQLKMRTPLYKKNSIYEGYNLLDLLEVNKIEIDKQDILIFEAKDGFKINIPVLFIKKFKPFLAIRDKALPLDKSWELIRDGGRIVDGGPFYLMWNFDEKEIPSNYWVFGATKIMLSSFSEAYGLSFPTSTKSLKIIRGFQIFQESCSGCHSINLHGGSLGPEMNVPLNFSEYLPRSFIKKYVQSPQSFRANANMPSQSSLKDFEIDLVMDYLVEMKNYKVCHTQEECKNLLNNEIK